MQSAELRSRAWVEVDLDALRANAETVCRAAGPGVGLLPMVKADAYGLGMAEIVRALAGSIAAERLAGFGVAAVAEGEALRAQGWPGRILVFSPTPPAEFERAADTDLTLCLSDLASVSRWASVAGGRGRMLPMHTEIDTGMGRAGFAWNRAAGWGGEVDRRAEGMLRWDGCFTHFHSADGPDLGPTHRQWERFRDAVSALPPDRGGSRRLLHVSNSAGALRCRFPGDLVRPGIFLYGGRVASEHPCPVVSVRARITLAREAAAGTSLGYGVTYVAQRPEQWGTLAIGYGDGLPRILGSAGGAALVHGRRVPIIGRISMDVAVVDLTDVAGAAAGDVATLIGRDGEEEITVEEVAERAGTISYEILTGLSPRLPRVYLSPSAPGG
ncbi:alanine racemase [soil metagenome]